MDADRNIIPIVEGDQGEGFMDPVEDYEGPGFGVPNEEPVESVKDYEGLTEKVVNWEGLKTAPHPPMLMQVGMSIHFYGFQYRVVKLLKRGRVVLKLMGRLPDEAKG